MEQTPTVHRSSAAQRPSIVIVEQEQTLPSVVVMNEQTQNRPSIVMLKQTEPVEVPKLQKLRQMCDNCYSGATEDVTNGSRACGGSITFTNAYKIAFTSELAEMALNFYNDNNPGQSFKLLKVCKANSIVNLYYGLTFRAKEDKSDECLVFRGVIRRRVALYCEIKDDDGIIKLRPSDDDYAGGWETEDSPTPGPLPYQLREYDDDAEAEVGFIARIGAMMARLFWTR